VATIVSQLLYPVLVWTRLRVPIVVVAELMHLGIALFLGLWLFSVMMIALNTAAWGQALWRALAGPGRRSEAPAVRAGHLRIVYDGACPFCDDYVRYQRLQAASGRVELIDARSHPEVLAEHAISHAHLEDGMVVVMDGLQYHGAEAVHVLSTLSEPPAKGWVRAVAALGRSRLAARLAYPFMKVGRRIALAFLGVPRFPRG
jgi:predicted DCC family thiol-disulfide oxidoreductase YuxK